MAQPAPGAQNFCFLFGNTVLFDAATLQTLYPTHQAFVDNVDAVMINAGACHTRLLADGWTVVTKDQSLSAQWEHTIAVTEHGFEVLTLGAGETAPA